MHERTVGIVLAGGRSRRFGSPKGLAILGGMRLIEWVFEAHRSVLSEIIVVVSESPSPYDQLGVPVVVDTLPGAGPVAGLHAGLRYASAAGADGVFCSSCDTPFISGKLIRALLAERTGVDAVVPEGQTPGTLQPLCGWYSTRVLSTLEASLREGVRALHRFIERIEPRRILPVTSLPAGLDPTILFHNVNTAADLEWAARLAAGSEYAR